MQADKFEEREIAVRKLASEIGEQLALKLRHATHPDREWEKVLKQLSGMVKHMDTIWSCTNLPNDPIGTRGEICKTGVDPADCLSMGGTPTTATCPNVDSTLPYASGQTTGSVE